MRGKVISTKVDDAEEAEIESIAKEQGKSKAEIVHDAIQAYLATRTANQRAARDEDIPPNVPRAAMQFLVEAAKDVKHPHHALAYGLLFWSMGSEKAFAGAYR